MKDYAVTIDLGGTKILSALIDKNDNIIERDKIPTEIGEGPEGIVESMIRSLDNLMLKSGKTLSDVEGVSLGVPGIINPFEGIIYNAPNLGIKNFNLKSVFSEKIGLPIFMENDVNLAGLGIKRVELKNNVKNMLVVFIGTGIGAALIFNGRLYRGSSFFAGEIGHMILNMKKPRKNNKTIEQFASRTAIVDRIINNIKSGRKSVLSEHIKAGKKIKSRALANAIAQKDNLVVEHFEEAMESLGILISNLQTLLNFDSIVLGGGVVEAMSDFIIDRIEKSFRKSIFDATGDCAKIFATSMGDDAPLYGGWELIQEGE